MATGTTERVMVKENGTQIDPNKKIFEINASGRTHALKVNYDDGEYDLYVFYQNRFFKTQFVYESTVLKYFYSLKLDKLIYVDTIIMNATDQSYVKISDGSVVTESEAVYPEGSIEQVFDDNGDPILDEFENPTYRQLTGLKPGYITEALYYENTIGPVVADSEATAIKRKFNLI